jgi:hypothetical protein
MTTFTPFARPAGSANRLMLENKVGPDDDDGDEDDAKEALFLSRLRGQKWTE